MQINSSNYIHNNMIFFKTLQKNLQSIYTYVSILVEDSVGKTYSISKNGIDISQTERNTHRGYVIRVYDEKLKLYTEMSSNIIGTKHIPDIIDKIRASLDNIPNGFSLKKYFPSDEESCTLNKSTNCRIDPESISDESIIKKIVDINQLVLDNSKNIVDVINVRTSYIYCKTHKLFLSNNKTLEQNILWSSGYLVPYVKNGDSVNKYLQCFSCLGGLELLDRIEAQVNNVINSAKEMTNTYPIEPGEYECICSPDVTGMIVHEAFGHGVEMDMFVKDRALAKDYIGKQVASPLVTMRDGAIGIEDSATYFFDDEGNLAHNTVIIDKGILKTGMNDTLTADELNIPTTGNGRRESYKSKAYTRMTNTYFEPGKDSLEEMISSIKYGFLLEAPSCGMEDPKNWGIQCMVEVAKEIKDGKFTGKVFSPIVLSGYVPDLLKSITMMSDTLYTCGSGYCGKGHKEWVKVSDGGPYIKARVKLG